MQSKKSNDITQICKVCFKPIKENFRTFFFGNSSICLDCYYEMNPKIYSWKEEGVRCVAIYPYEGRFQTLLYQFKGVNDIELYSVFLDQILPIIKIMFRGYYIVPVPSSDSHNLNRGYNQVEEMYKVLGLPFLKILRKTEDHKQSNLSFEKRKEVGRVLKFVEKLPNLEHKKILLVDDVFTTGSTIRACIKLLKKLNPKKIKVLVSGKTRL